MTLREQAARADSLLLRRLDTLVPKLLAEAAIDCWLVIGREYAEGPVLSSMLPATWLSARRTTMLVLTPDTRLAIARYPVGPFPNAWDPAATPDQWERLAEIVRQIDPRTIGVDMSATQAHADGLTATLRQRLDAALGEPWSQRIVAAGDLGIRWLETRLPEERPVLEAATAVAHDILRRGLSREAVVPGATTTDDLVWWYRQQVHDGGFASWFHPSVSIQRRGAADDVIRPGDLLHVDFGIVYEGLCTDQQEHAYVCDLGEDQAPNGLTTGLHLASRVQDVLMAEFQIGRTGNEILAGALAVARAEGLDPTIYTHSIGIHGHGAGMTIGLWDQQHGVPGAGDHVLHPDTAYSIELSNRTLVPEWGDRAVDFMLEQDAWFDGTVVEWLDGRQTELHLI